MSRMDTRMSEERRTKALDYLRRSLDRSDAEFRPGQWEAIEEILGRNRLLVVQRTGWGKSVVYFLATRLMRDEGAGPTLLVSPLLSLMRDQIKAAERIGVRAATINSANRDEWPDITRGIAANEVDLLLISPERLANEEFRENVLLPIAGKIGLFVVDEAHCISDWGHDFRPDYRRIVTLLNLLPRNVAVLATTATANDRVVRDVAHQLGNVNVIRGPLVRTSLRLQNISLPSQSARYAWLAQHVADLPGSGIIYTLTVRDAERVAAWLRSRDLDVEAYHADSPNRPALEQALLRNELKALVATVALGMGFDKPDLGFVVHFQRPGSVVYYYQQVGRAGRALDEAFAILLGGSEDDDIANYFIKTAFPPASDVETVLHALESSDGLTVRQIERSVNLSHSKIEKALKLLSVESPAPVVKEGARWFRTAIEFHLDQERIDRILNLRRAEQTEMQSYVQIQSCLMHFLARSLDDPYAEPCGRCANCLGQPLIPAEFDASIARDAVTFLRHAHETITPRKLWTPDSLPQYGFRGRIEVGLSAEPGKALARWGDAGWGDLIRHGKYVDGHFHDDLVAACAELVRQWSPRPRPRWVACVPSNRHPTLVPEFAKRLAAELELPYSDCVKKVKENRPQKEMENSMQQSRNLDGTFEIDANRMPAGPVLLFDDMIDSGWTLTVIAALLREARCPAVFPLVLANTKGMN